MVTPVEQPPHHKKKKYEYIYLIDNTSQFIVLRGHY